MTATVRFARRRIRRTVPAAAVETFRPDGRRVYLYDGRRAVEHGPAVSGTTTRRRS